MGRVQNAWVSNLQSPAVPLSELGPLILPLQGSGSSSVEWESPHQPDLTVRSLGCRKQKHTWAHSSKEWFMFHIVSTTQTSGYVPGTLHSSSWTSTTVFTLEWLYFPKMATMLSPMPQALLEFCPFTIKRWSLISLSLDLDGLVTHLWLTECGRSNSGWLLELDHKRQCTFWHVRWNT